MCSSSKLTTAIMMITNNKFYWYWSWSRKLRSWCWFWSRKENSWSLACLEQCHQLEENILNLALRKMPWLHHWQFASNIVESADVVRLFGYSSIPLMVMTIYIAHHDWIKHCWNIKMIERQWKVFTPAKCPIQYKHYYWYYRGVHK